MFEVRQTSEFMHWLAALRDQRAAARIEVRIRRLAIGNAGDVRAVGEGISEMRIDYGPGYRVYYRKTGQTLVVLLCGGDKHTQEADIARAKFVARNLNA